MRSSDSQPHAPTVIARRHWRTVIVVGLVMAFCAVMGAMFSLSEVTTAATSPDGTVRAEIVDRKVHFIDRNFRVRIVNRAGKATVVFTSPDENPRGIGHERLLWSSDSRRLLLVGRNFWARGEAKLTSGESLYLLYDVPSGRVWCNSDQQGPPFGQQELANHQFGELFVAE